MVSQSQGAEASTAGAGSASAAHSNARSTLSSETCQTGPVSVRPAQAPGQSKGPPCRREAECYIEDFGNFADTNHCSVCARVPVSRQAWLWPRRRGRTDLVEG